MLLDFLHAAQKARALRMILDPLDGKLGMGERCGEPRHREIQERRHRPVSPPRETAGEDPHIIGVIGDGEGDFLQIVERLRGTKGRDDPRLRPPR